MIRLNRRGWRIVQMRGSLVAHVIGPDGVDHPTITKIRGDMSGEELDKIIHHANKPRSEE